MDSRDFPSTSAQVDFKLTIILPPPFPARARRQTHEKREASRGTLKSEKKWRKKDIKRRGGALGGCDAFGIQSNAKIHARLLNFSDNDIPSDLNSFFSGIPALNPVLTRKKEEEKKGKRSKHKKTSDNS